MLIAVLSGFIVALLVLLAGRFIKGAGSIMVSFLPVALFIYFLQLAPAVAVGSLPFNYPWVPALGVDLNFTLDGLALLFCLLITGIGTLVFAYTAAYLKGHKYLDRLFCYLCIFMASMLGLVLSDNVITLFVFWELTSISSFFLIGFNNDEAASRRSALLALAITGGGGFLLLAGFVLMGNINGNYSIAAMVANKNVFAAHEWYTTTAVLVMAGAFTKSAQFPFHFWLPGAMKAPTPVSAYLHSATMVKAGIYLLARLTPVLGCNIIWNSTLLIVGSITMVYAAFHALFRTDLKSILAYSTISALGIIVFLLGIGTTAAITAATVFILVHALYKAGLFLIAGIIDHETGTRDVTVLRGLRKVLLPVAFAGVLAAISSAGLPFSIGFLGKELIYESTLHGGDAYLVHTIAAVLTNILLLYAGFVAGITPFTGSLPAAMQKVHLPSPLMWVPPLLLGIAGIVVGIFPSVIDAPLLNPVVLAVAGERLETSLKVWHGFNTVLLLSAITVTAGVALYFVLKPATRLIDILQPFKHWSPQYLVTTSAKKIIYFADRFTALFQNGYLRNYVLIIVCFIVVLLSYKLYTGVNIYVSTKQLQQITVYEGAIVGVMIVAIIKTLQTSSRLIAVSSMGVMGYCICLLFVFYSAPDLAMTQFSIDTLTVVLFVLVLFRLPPFLKLTQPRTKIRDAIVSVAFGGLLSIIALEVLNEKVSKETSRYYAENAYLLAKGKNVVNVILVDFRGLDTLVEITVLTIAAIGVYSMLKLKIGVEEKE